MLRCSAHARWTTRVQARAWPIAQSDARTSRSAATYCAYALVHCVHETWLQPRYELLAPAEIEVVAHQDHRVCEPLGCNCHAQPRNEPAARALLKRARGALVQLGTRDDLGEPQRACDGYSSWLREAILMWHVIITSTDLGEPGAREVRHRRRRVLHAHLMQRECRRRARVCLLSAEWHAR